ncbi:39872_t:CDS:2, partial [Gigaspora margarita]
MFSPLQNLEDYPINDNDSNDLYEEILIDCNNEESLEHSNNEETGSETDDEEKRVKMNNLFHNYIPIINNIVIHLYYEDDPVNKKFIEKAKKFYPIIKYSQPNSANSTKLKSKIKKRIIENLILGGDGLHNVDGSLKCSAGLWVQDENYVDYLLTAGHCYQGSPLNPSGYVEFYLQGWYSQPTYNYIGPLVYYSSVTHDFGLIRHVNTNSTLTTMIDNSDHPNLYKHLLIEEASNIDDVGVHVCKSGFSTHVVCGQVTELNVESSYQLLNGRTFIWRELIGTDMGTIGGDSGGPVFSYSPIKLPYVSVVGITIAGDESKTEYIPLSVILRVTRLNFNLSIIVTP